MPQSRWAQTIDEGPFSSLCWGERIAFGNPEALTLLGALAAWTHRVPLITTVVVPQLHDPVLLAKSLATGDMLCGGRLTVGVGVGGRQEDYLAVGADPSTQTMREMAQRVEIMKRVWAGEKITESVLPVGPVPVHSGGPRLLIGTIGRCAVPHRGLTVWPASHWISTLPNRTNCSRSAAPPGRRPASRNPIWLPRSGSPSVPRSIRAPRFTVTCGTT